MPLNALSGPPDQTPDAPPNIQLPTSDQDSSANAFAQGLSGDANNAPTLKAPSLWQRVLQGALQGLASGGAAGAIVGGAESTSADQFNRMQTARAQRQQALQQQLQDGSARLAHAQVENQILQNQWSNMPKTFQDALLRESKTAGDQLTFNGNPPMISGITEDAAKQFLTHVYDSNPNEASHYVMHSNGADKFDIFKIADPNAVNRSPLEITTALVPGRNPDGSLDWANPTAAKSTVPPGSVKIADAQASPVIAASKYWNTYNNNQAAIQKSDATGATAKNDALAVKAARPPAVKDLAADPNNVVGGFDALQGRINDVASFVNSPAMSKVDPVAASRILEAQGVTLGAHGMGASISLPMGGATAGNLNDYIKNTNPETLEYVNRLKPAYEAISQLPRLQTYGKSSRMSPTQMEAAKQLLPAAYDNQVNAASKLDKLQSTLDDYIRHIPNSGATGVRPSWRAQSRNQ
jgi:hypothetical protein